MYFFGHIPIIGTDGLLHESKNNSVRVDNDNFMFLQLRINSNIRNLWERKFQNIFIDFLQY